MKLSPACLTVLFLILCSAVLGQDVRKVQEPEYLGNFFLLDSSTGNLIPLERQTPATTAKGTGYAGEEVSIEFKEEKSPVRFKEGQELQFVVLVSSQQTDPQTLQFFSLASKNGKRRLVTAKRNFMGTKGKSVMGEKAVPFNATKYGTSSFKITAAQKLSPGEYVLGAPGTHDGFCFGIDPVNARP
jgi:hypothetical protein